ncbi:MAG TPA: hypothetical protein VIF43_00605 [Patescibacteria group bacterium]|jgi:hypothetical protein
MPEKAKTGDEVRTGGQTRTGEVKKVKPDGTRVIKTRTGTLQEDKDPQKPAKLDAEKDED